MEAMHKLYQSGVVASQADARVTAAGVVAQSEGPVVASLRRQLAEEQVKRVQAESALAWLQHDLRELVQKVEIVGQSVDATQVLGPELPAVWLSDEVVTPQSNAARWSPRHVLQEE